MQEKVHTLLLKSMYFYVSFYYTLFFDLFSGEV